MVSTSSAPSSSPVDQFVHRTQNVPEPSQTVDGQTTARVPFKTAYVLTGDQEQELITHAVKRMKEMEKELGRSNSEGDTWFHSFVISAGTTWRTHFGKRFVYDQIYHNEVAWRKWLLGGIFATMNHCVPIVRGVCSQMIARANNYFFATDPWFSSYPMGEAAKSLAEKLDRWTQWKFGLSDIKKCFEKATELAFIRGESVIKTTYETKEQIFKQVSTVLTDPDGKDILDAHGDYINISDVWVPQLTDPQTDPSSGLAVPQTPTGGFVLKRDMSTPKPAPAVIRWVTKTVTRRRTMFRGAKSEVVYYRDFLCPLNAASVQDADCIAHLYDMPLMDMIDTYVRKGLIRMSAEDQDEAMQRVISQIRSLASSSGQAKSAAGQPRPELDQVNFNESQSAPIFQAVEFHLRYDADGDGIMENIMLIIDRNSEVPLFYDFIDNITPDGERPFDVIRVNEVDGRWYGIGAMEMFESSQETIDLLVNRWHLSQSEAGRVTLWRPYLTLEGDSNKNLQLNNKRTYTPKPGVKNEEVLSYITLPDIKHADLKDAFQFYMQLVTNESGVATANDAQIAGLDSSELATGVRDIKESGQEKFSMFLSPLERGFTSASRRNMRLELAHIDGDETFVFFEADQVATDTLMMEDAQSVMVDIQLLLTRYRGQQIVQSSTQAANSVVQFYSYPVAIQAHVAEFYRDILKALQMQDADKTIVPGAGQIMQGGGGQPGKPGQSGTPAGMPQLNPGALTQALNSIPPGQGSPNV